MTAMDALTDAEVAAKVRDLWVIPGMDDPGWVGAELERRGQRPILNGEHFDAAEPLGLAITLNIPRWAILGGCEPTVDTVPTAQQVNRGRLVAAMLEESRG